MKLNHLIKPFGLAALAIALCLGLSVGVTYAYYTDATEASGTITIPVDPTTTTIDEDPDEAGKTIQIVNESDSPAIVRVKLYYADANAAVTVSGEKWSLGEDGWLYYTDVLWGAQETDALRADITSDGKTDALNDFDVTVVSQGVPVEWVYGEGDEKGSEAGNFDGTVVTLKELNGIEGSQPYNHGIGAGY